MHLQYAAMKNKGIYYKVTLKTPCVNVTPFNNAEKNIHSDFHDYQNRRHPEKCSLSLTAS